MSDDGPDRVGQGRDPDQGDQARAGNGDLPGKSFRVEKTCCEFAGTDHGYANGDQDDGQADAEQQDIGQTLAQAAGRGGGQEDGDGRGAGDKATG